MVLVDDDVMRQINRTSRDRDAVTDVISFAYAPAPGMSTDAGEVIVNVEQAVREGPQHEGIPHELALYMAHGCHHLAGATDDTPHRRRHMRRVEESWIREAAQRNLIERLIEPQP